jgi:hypothetical protein
MNNYLGDIIFWILIAFITYIANKYLVPIFQRRLNPIKSIIPFDASPKKLNLCYGLIPPGTTGRSYTAEEGDLAAIYMIYDIFSSLYTRKKIHIQNHKSAESNLDNIDNISSLSGPKWNKVTERLIGEIGSPVFFSKSKNGIILKKKKRRKKAYQTYTNPLSLSRKGFGYVRSYLSTSLGYISFNIQKEEKKLNADTNPLLLTRKGCRIILSFLSRILGDVVYKDQVEGEMTYSTVRTPPNLARRCYGIILSGIINRSGGTRQRVMICAGNTTLSMFGIAAYLKQLANERDLIRMLKKYNITNKKRWGLIIEVTNNLPPGKEGLIWLPMDLSTISLRVIEYIEEEDFLQPYVYNYDKNE